MRLGEIVKMASYVEAKALHLRAIDFTIGLLKRMQRLGKKFPIDYNIAINRLKQMRKLSQSKFRMDTLQANIKKLRGAKSDQLLKKIEKVESKYAGTEEDMAAFRQDFPDKLGPSQDKQEQIYLARIMPALGVKTPKEVEDLILTDQEAFDKAYNAILPLLKKLKADVDSMMPKNLGGYASRIKEAGSSFKKQTREGARFPLFQFRDLVGCRIITADVGKMCAVARECQQKLGIVQKKNYFKKGKGYNAINYVLGHKGLMFEFQLKTSVNDIEANISHDLIYAKEKAVVQLSQREKDLVAKVIDASTQLSMREWTKLMGLETVTSKARRLGRSRQR